MALLEVQDIHTYYGHIHALRGVSLTVEEGEIVTLIGGNGAGKSTTLNTISGVTPPATDRSSWTGWISRGCRRTTSSGWALTQAPEGGESSPA